MSFFAVFLCLLAVNSSQITICSKRGDQILSNISLSNTSIPDYEEESLLTSTSDMSTKDPGSKWNFLLVKGFLILSLNMFLNILLILGITREVTVRKRNPHKTLFSASPSSGPPPTLDTWSRSFPSWPDFCCGCSSLNGYKVEFHSFPNIFLSGELHNHHFVLALHSHSVFCKTCAIASSAQASPSWSA